MQPHNILTKKYYDKTFVQLAFFKIQERRLRKKFDYCFPKKRNEMILTPSFHRVFFKGCLMNFKISKWDEILSKDPINKTSLGHLQVICHKKTKQIQLKRHFFKKSFLDYYRICPKMGLPHRAYSYPPVLIFMLLCFRQIVQTLFCCGWNVLDFYSSGHAKEIVAGYFNRRKIKND